MRELIARALTPNAPAAAFTANDGFGRALLAARVALVLAAWFALVRRDDRAERALFAVACGLFVASLAFAALLVPFAVCGLAAVARGAMAASLRARIATALGAAAALAALLAVGWLAARPAKPLPRDVAGLTGYWIERDNLFRARSSAAQWARAEGDAPGDAVLALAAIEWELGRHDAARALAKDVVVRGRDPRVQRRAQAQLAEWEQ